MKSWGKFIVQIAQAYRVFYAAVSSNLRVMLKCGELNDHPVLSFRVFYYKAKEYIFFWQG